MKNMVRSDASLQPKVSFFAQIAPNYSHYESRPIPDFGYLPNVVVVERFESILEKMDKRCCQDDARSKVFTNEEQYMWE